MTKYHWWQCIWKSLARHHQHSEPLADGICVRTTRQPSKCKNKTSRLNCFIEFESVFPTSSTRVAANQKMATAWSSDIFCTRIVVSGASSRELYGWAWFVQMQYMRCLIHLDHDVENCIKYATSVEQSFRKTSGPSEVAMHWINQLMSVWSRA